MAIVYDTSALNSYMTGASPRRPAIPSSSTSSSRTRRRLDVDAIADTTGAVVIGGIMEHIEEAGIHSGDSSCVRSAVPGRAAPRRADSRLHAAHRPGSKGDRADECAIRHQGRHGVRARGQPAGVAAVSPVSFEGDRGAARQVTGRVMIGRTLAEQELTEDLEVAGVFLKTQVFPFVRFPGVDTILGPEMKSTGEVMGGATTFGSAFAKARIGTA